jgi:threonine dehydrogenase-like Zn-dependent dehydrogenase
MATRLVCSAPGEIGWLEVPEREPGEGEVRVRPTHGVEKHGTMAAFVKGYANERGRWDADGRIHRPEGVLWGYPVPLGNMQFGTTDEGEHVAWWGPFQDFSVVSRAALRPLSEIDWRDAAMQDPGEFALGALRDGGVRIGDDVAVFGLGAIGLAAVQLARTAGARRVFAVDPIAPRRAAAERFGAIPIFADDSGMAIRQATDMRGVDVVVDFSGASRALQAGFRAIAYGGTIAYGAFPAPFPAGLDLGGEFHMNRPRIVSSRACSDPNPDHPRWSEDRIRETVWTMIEREELRGEGIVDEPVPFSELPRVYPEIAKHPESHLKLSVEYPR